MTVFVRAKGVRLHTITVGRHCGELDGSDVELLVGANVSGASAPGGGGCLRQRGRGSRVAFTWRVCGGHSLSHGARMGGTKLHHTGRSKVW
jgi:hypothetical protein